MDRLSTIAPEVAERLRRCSKAERREVVVAACDFALSRLERPDPLVREAHQQLHRGEPLLPEQRHALESLAAQWDEQYLALQETQDDRVSDAEIVRAFSRARAVSALRHAFDDNSLTAATEAVYEAAMTVDDPAELFSRIDHNQVGQTPA